MSCCSLWTASSFPLKPSAPPSKTKKLTAAVAPSSFLCLSHHRAEPSSNDNYRRSSGAAALPLLVLHDSLDSAGIETKFARMAREQFCEQIERMTGINSETSIAISKGPDLARAALNIAAEDDSLVSHSSVPLPVDAFLGRLDDLAMGFCSLYMPPSRSAPEVFIANLERYFYVHKGFQRIDVMADARALYLHSVLTRRSGSAIMLSLIYSEMLKMLRVLGFLDFDVEIYFPHDFVSLPRSYHKQKSKISDQPHIMTSKSLLVEILRNLKDAFWPFQYDLSNSLFLRAARAANHIYRPSVIGETYSKSHNDVSGFEIASSKAAQHRLGRGVWTNVRFGDMRRALAACERLVLLLTDDKELRDYAVLLYHCGYYKECLQYLELYQSSRSCTQESPSSITDELEEDTVDKLISRVSLILGEEGWRTPSTNKSYWSNNREPW